MSLSSATLRKLASVLGPRAATDLEAGLGVKGAYVIQAFGVLAANVQNGAFDFTVASGFDDSDVPAGFEASDFTDTGFTLPEGIYLFTLSVVLGGAASSSVTVRVSTALGTPSATCVPQPNGDGDAFITGLYSTDHGSFSMTYNNPSADEYTCQQLLVYLVKLG